MEKIKNLGATIAEKCKAIVERAKTDKKFLGALIGGAVVIVVAIVALIVALSGSNGGGQLGINGDTTTHKVTVLTQGGAVLADIDVQIYDDEALTSIVDNQELSESGSAEFQLVEGDEYYISVVGAPKGYNVEKYYTFDGTTADITLTSSLITGEDISTAVLGVGDIMYDFTVTTPDGTEITLSELLKEKKMVLLNFWYTTCSWCVTEFPIMAEAYELYKDDIAIVALNPMGEGNDAIASFQQTYDLPFYFAECPTSWSNTFSISGYPTSVLIDRYGAICVVEAGAITSLRPFICAFEHFTAEPYKQVFCYEGVSELVTQIKPTYKMPSSDEIAAVLNLGDIQVTYRPETEDANAEYIWPFIIGEKNGESCIYASNQEIEDSYAIIYADVYLEKGQALRVDYLASTETGSDVMHVIVNDEAIFTISGVSEDETWKRCYPVVAEESGTYEVAFCYAKDSDTNEGDDTVYIKNLSVVSESEIDTATYIPYKAAVETEDGYEYAELVYNSTDGYYHVGTKNGPLLLAEIMGYTDFNEEQTVYDVLLEDKELIIDGKNRFEDIEQYCSYASNSNLTGVCTVTKELAELLQAYAEQYGFEDDENEWLKMCKYYKAYGTTEQLEDPIKGLATFSAYTAHLGSGNSFTYNRIIIPRGLMAEFVPTQSGVYRITSHNDSQQGVDGWIFNENREQLYVYEAGERKDVEEGEVSMLYYMEAGTPYYIDIAFWDTYEVGTITYDIEYVGSTYTAFTLASPGYFTYDSDATGSAMYYIITGGIDVVLGSDGIYYEDLGNGKKGSKLYCDFTGITGVFSNPITTNSGVTGMIDMGGFDFSKTENDMYILAIMEANNNDVDATDEYLQELWGEDYEAYAEEYQLDDVYAGIYHGDGEDYTDEIKKYTSQMISGGDADGCVVVTKELAEILQLLMDKYTFENVDNSWTKLCYYYDYLGPEN